MVEGGHLLLIEQLLPKFRPLRVTQALHLVIWNFLQLLLEVEQEGDHRGAVSLPELVVEASRLDQISIEGVVGPGEDLGGEEEGSHHLLPLDINSAVVHLLGL